MSYPYRVIYTGVDAILPKIVKHVENRSLSSIFDGDKIRLTVLMLGGGPAIRGVTQRIFHRHSVEEVIDEIVRRANPAVSQLGCYPCTLQSV